jgi:hypothetical protein
MGAPSARCAPAERHLSHVPILRQRPSGSTDLTTRARLRTDTTWPERASKAVLAFSFTEAHAAGQIRVAQQQSSDQEVVRPERQQDVADDFRNGGPREHQRVSAIFRGAGLFDGLDHGRVELTGARDLNTYPTRRELCPQRAGRAEERVLRRAVSDVRGALWQR